MATAKVELAKPFEQEGELKAKEERLSELNALLNMDADKDGGERGFSDIVDDVDEPISADRPAPKMSVLDRLHKMQDKAKDLCVYRINSAIEKYLFDKYKIVII